MSETPSRAELATSLKCLQDDFYNFKHEAGQFEKDVRDLSRTPWGVIASCAGFLVLVLGLFFAPYANSLLKLEAKLAAHEAQPGHAAILARHSEFSSQMKREVKRLDAMIEDIRHEPPRSMAVETRAILDILQKRVDRLEGAQHR